MMQGQKRPQGDNFNGIFISEYSVKSNRQELETNPRVFTKELEV